MQPAPLAAEASATARPNFSEEGNDCARENRREHMMGSHHVKEDDAVMLNREDNVNS